MILQTNENWKKKVFLRFTRNCPIIAPPLVEKIPCFHEGGGNYWELKNKAICLEKKYFWRKKNNFGKKKHFFL